MNMKKMMMALAAGSLAIAAQALTLSVKDVKIAQRYPWNGLVDIDYTVVCDDAAADVYVYPVGYDVDMNVSVAPRTLTGDGANGKAVKAGTHRMTWDMGTDMGANYNRAKFSMKMHAYANAAPYLVIDLSAGSNAEKYEVSYLSEMPAAAWPLEYKTTKLVLKLVVPGTFMMGSSAEELGHDWYSSGFETRHQVTLTQPFYMGVFELTQQQYNLVMGSNPSSYKGDSRPVERVSYETIRGSTLGAAWPNHRQVDATSFMGKLRARTGLTFDLPTEAQWEYTCRAGTDSALNNGKNLTNTQTDSAVAEVARYGSNNNDGKGGYSQHTEVGSYRPNAWGFYDMHGNVAEWCLDWWTDNLSVSSVTDPVGRATGTYRLGRG
ncbi:MAG: formylglycine-generating enzyme family protein [Kiritimatiellae bacterium]|nr:formylglycine-generating enzyme family protein [Kiritimatiellia bacterium]